MKSKNSNHLHIQTKKPNNELKQKTKMGRKRMNRHAKLQRIQETTEFANMIRLDILVAPQNETNGRNPPFGQDLLAHPIRWTIIGQLDPTRDICPPNLLL